jgi:hypothetical protein
MASRTTPPPLGPYDHFEVLSALRKSVKLADTEAAIYWLNVLLTHGGRSGPTTAAKQLWIMAAEDVDDPQIVLRAFAVVTMAGKVPETDHLVYLTAAMCSARKWWETADGREVDRLWSKAIGDLKRQPREVPTYALDRHTRRGWDRFRAGLGFDDRFSGTEIGRAKTTYLYTRDGSLSPDAQIDDGFWPVWRERRALEGMTPEDPDHEEDAAPVEEPPL